MRNMKYNSNILLVLALLAANLAFGQVYERNRSETKSWKVYSQTSLEIVNKYGNINLFNWSKDSVRIEIKAQVKASKEQKADKLFEFIDFEFNDSKYYIVAKTQLRQNQGSFWAELSDLANTVFSGNNKIQIDYDVYLPADMELKLENKFGNIYMTNYQGKLSIDLSNGDLKAYNLSGQSDITLSFGNATINTIDNGYMDLSYAELNLDSANELQLESKSSEIEIGKLGTLQINSRRDKLQVDELSILTGESSFTYITLDRFEKDIKLKTEFGDLKINEVALDFHQIDLESKYSDLLIKFSPSASTDINVEYSETTGIYYPDKYSTLKTSVLDEKTGKKSLNGNIGVTQQNSPMLKITIQAGKVTFQELISDNR